jgi:cysteine-rich repeat protein
VETLTTLNGFDVMFLADDFIVLQNMVIEGGTNGDLLWANAGDDTVRGNMGDDLIDGGLGDDMIQGGLGDDTITLWPGSGFDSVSGDLGSGNMSLTDRVEVDAIQSQILITPAANPSYEFDIFYLGIPMAQITEVELLVMNDATIDLTMCAGGMSDVCNLCGNDDLNGGEGCDDGNNVDGDGCAADCTAEY